MQNLQNDLDRENAEKKKLCVMMPDDTPYTIPEGNWFAGSMVPDFSNPETVKSWFEKRKYLLRGGDIDYERTAKAILDDFRKCRIGKISF